MARLDQAFTASAVFQLLVYALGDAEAIDLISNVEVATPMLVSTRKGYVDRSTIALTAALIQLHDFLRRAPTARRYFQEVKPAAEKITLEQCDLYTVSDAQADAPGDTERMIHGILTSLGYALESAGWGGITDLQLRRYRHADVPDVIPKMNVYEIQAARLPEDIRQHLADFTPTLAAAVPPALSEQLCVLRSGNALNFHDASDVVLKITRCFERLHGIPKLDAYQAIESHSKAISWFATEGHAVQKLVIRSSNFFDLRQRLEQAGIQALRPHSPSGSENITEVCLISDPMQRRFEGATGSFVEYSVDGPRLEFSQ